MVSIISKGNIFECPLYLYLWWYVFTVIFFWGEILLIFFLSVILDLRVFPFLSCFSSVFWAELIFPRIFLYSCGKTPLILFSYNIFLHFTKREGDIKKLKNYEDNFKLIYHQIFTGTIRNKKFCLHFFFLVSLIITISWSIRIGMFFFEINIFFPFIITPKTKIAFKSRRQNQLFFFAFTRPIIVFCFFENKKKATTFSDLYHPF